MHLKISLMLSETGQVFDRTHVNLKFVERLSFICRVKNCYFVLSIKADFHPHTTLKLRQLKGNRVAS